MQDANENTRREPRRLECQRAQGWRLARSRPCCGCRAELDFVAEPTDQGIGPRCLPDDPAVFDISTTDVYREPDFTQLAAALVRPPSSCARPPSPSASSWTSPRTRSGDDPQPGAGFDLTAVASPTPKRLDLPADGGTPANHDDATAKAKTDGNGFVNFQWQTTTPTASSVRITEQDPSGGVAGFPGLDFDPSIDQRAPIEHLNSPRTGP